MPASERPARYATLLRDDPIAKRLAYGEGGGGGGGGGGGVRDATSGLAVVGVVCPPNATGGAGAADEHAVLHDGVTSSSFGARGLGRCE